MLIFSAVFCYMCIFLFKQNTAYELRISDWMSDVCSSELDGVPAGHRHRPWDHHYLLPLPDAAAIRPKTADDPHRHDFSGRLSLCRDDRGRELLYIQCL